MATEDIEPNGKNKKEGTKADKSNCTFDEDPPLMEQSLGVNSDEDEHESSHQTKSSHHYQGGIGSNGSAKQVSQYTVNVSKPFILLSVLLCTLVAFAVGRTARYLLVVKPHAALLINADKETKHIGHLTLPSPIMKDGMAVPQTEYTAKNFDTARSASINSRFIVTDEGEQCDAAAASKEGEAKMDGEIHEPKGQHLLIDIAHVDSAFLASEERLVTAMLELVRQCGLTLLSYHCHGLEPSGVSCAGVLLESHVSFHTWPAEGVITLDLYTCGPGSLLPFVSTSKDLFAIPSSLTKEDPETVWSHKFRGFTEHLEDEIAERADFFRFPIGIMTDYKEQIVSAETDFQRVDIYDVLRPHFQSFEDLKKSLENDGSYESQHPEFYEPDRIVFLDGILQSRRSGDSAYHESLVHPGMFSHPNPKRVAIVGGGEGATLREVLKHKTVEEVVMIEIDEKMVELSKKYLPFWSDCSALKGSTANCFDDPRVDANYVDAFKWFIDRYGGEGEITEDKFDVIIMDALDPQVQVDIVEALYDGGPFLKSLPNALRDNGILVAQVGEAAKMEAPGEEYSWHKNRVRFIETLINIGFESVRDYEESHAGFYYPWQFVVAFKDFQGRAGWFLDEAMTNLEIRQRIIPTEDGKSTLQYFDGPTMLSYRFPSKASEKVFCLRQSKSEMCQDFNEGDRPNSPISLIKAKSDSGKAHVAFVDFALNSYEDGGVPSYSQYFWSLFKSQDGPEATREKVIHKYFSGENTYNPFADRQYYLYSNAIPGRKTS